MHFWKGPNHIHCSRAGFCLRRAVKMSYCTMCSSVDGAKEPFRCKEDPNALTNQPFAGNLGPLCSRSDYPLRVCSLHEGLALCRRARLQAFVLGSISFSRVRLSLKVADYRVASRNGESRTCTFGAPSSVSHWNATQIKYRDQISY